jgi:two-component system, OmpR family, response regulator MprA
MPDQVLLIDDDPRLVMALQIRLTALGYLVHAAHGGEDGLSAAKRLRPHVIVLDVNMPGMDGLQVCRLVRADQELRATPVIMMSAVTHDIARQAAIDAGANQFLGKPYQAAQVMAAIRAAIESQRLTGGGVPDAKLTSALP